MIRASKVLPAGTWDRTREIDCVALAHDGRHRRRIVMNAEGGLDFLLELVETKMLHDGDGLELESGRVVRVVAASEPVVDVSGDAHLLSRIAWQRSRTGGHDRQARRPDRPGRSSVRS
jgi:urease accessory protein